MRDAFGVAVQVLTQSRVTAFKVAGHVVGLLRPDKLVAYFADLEGLQEAADDLRRMLKTCPSHGVPFTAGLDEGGLLSWGLDPIHAGQGFVWQEGESWRVWLTNQLAVALLQAKRSRSQALEPWQFALERLRLEGVDTDSWIPGEVPAAQTPTHPHESLSTERTARPLD